MHVSLINLIININKINKIINKLIKKVIKLFINCRDT